MSKAILIMDMPNCCGECEMSGTGVCRKWNRKDLRSFPKECPLKEIPEHREVNSDPYHVSLTEAYDFGYNACLDEILKERD